MKPMCKVYPNFPHDPPLKEKMRAGFDVRGLRTTRTPGGERSVKTVLDLDIDGKTVLKKTPEENRDIRSETVIPNITKKRAKRAPLSNNLPSRSQRKLTVGGQIPSQYIPFSPQTQASGSGKQQAPQ